MTESTRDHSFSKLLIRKMEERAMTIRQAATVAGVPPSTIQGWRTGRAPTNFAAIKKLAIALGTTLDGLLTGDDSLAPRADLTIDDVIVAKKNVLEGYCYIRVQQLIPRADHAPDRGDSAAAPTAAERQSRAAAK